MTKFLRRPCISVSLLAMWCSTCICSLKETDLVFLLWCMRLIICMHYFWCRYYIPWFETRKHFAPSRWAHCADWFWPLIFDFFETPCKLRKPILSAVKTFLEYLTDSLSAGELFHTDRIWNILKIKSKAFLILNHLWLFHIHRIQSEDNRLPNCQEHFM